jgi:multidrug transporter EmrE-like cation transporter
MQKNQTSGTEIKSKMDIAIIYILVAVAGSSIGQILLKIGMGRLGQITISPSQLFNIVWRIGTNPYIIIGLCIYLFGTLFWLSALSRVPLSYAYPFASISYIVMLGASVLLFKEEISLPRFLGTAIIGLGVLVISRS